MPPAVNQSNVKHYRHTNSVTDYKEFAGRSHYTVGQDDGRRSLTTPSSGRGERHDPTGGFSVAQGLIHSTS